MQVSQTGCHKSRLACKKWQKIYHVYTVLLTHCRLNEISHTIYWKLLILILGISGSVIYILEASNFNYRYIRLCDLHIPREK